MCDNSKKYMNVQEVYETILEIYKECVKEYENEPYFDIWGYSEEDILEEMAMQKAQAINEDMKKYLHAKDHSIPGNFRNISYNYKGDLSDLIKRLDAGVEDDKTNADRQFLTDWFWDMAGTFGIRYNFKTELAESAFVDFYAEEDSLGRTGEDGMVKSYDIGWNNNIDNWEESAREEGMSLEDFLQRWWNETGYEGREFTWQRLGKGDGHHGDTILKLGNVVFKDIDGQLMIDEYPTSKL